MGIQVHFLAVRWRGSGSCWICQAADSIMRAVCLLLLFAVAVNAAGYDDDHKKGGYGKDDHHDDHYGHHDDPYDDHLDKTKHKIDNYLAKKYLLGKRRVRVQLKYLNSPLEWQYLGQYHGLRHPLTYTKVAPVFGMPYKPYQSPYAMQQGHGYGMQSYGMHGGQSYGNQYGNQYQSTQYGGQSYGAAPQPYGHQQQQQYKQPQGYGD